MYFGLYPVYDAGTSNVAYPNFICVHGLGPSQEDTWHHDESGKTWTQDEEFLGKLEQPCRVWHYIYNGDVSANMSAASIAFHAYDLSSYLESEMRKSDNTGPCYFIAHSWGGAIVKKAISLCWTLDGFSTAKATIAGAFFLGTPHSTQDVGAVLQAVKDTTAAFGPDDKKVTEQEMREYALGVCEVNESFQRQYFPLLRVRSFWEKQDTTIPSSSPESSGTRIVPEHRLRIDPASDQNDTTMDCSHEDMACFSSATDRRFLDFLAQLKTVIAEVQADKEFNSRRILAQAAEESRPPTPPQSSSSTPEPPEKPTEPSEPVQQAEPAAKSDIPEQPTVLTEEESNQCEVFLRSLRGWSEANTGHHLDVAPGTCKWHLYLSSMEIWKTEDVVEGLMIVAAQAGQGKTHLAKAISNQLKEEDQSALVLSFFCTPDNSQPAIWEYFTWALINHSKICFKDIPQQYLHRDEKSGPLSFSAFSQIWLALYATVSQQLTYLIIDGLEGYGDEYFQEFMTALGALQRKFQSYSQPTTSTPVKVLLTCRPTPAVEQARISLTTIVPRSTTVAVDVSNYVDARIRRIIGQRKDVDLEWVESTIRFVQDESKAFWPFAVSAIDSIEKSFLRNQQDKITIDTGEYMPEAMKHWIEDREFIKYHLHSVNNDWRTRAFITLIASYPGVYTFAPKVVKSVLQCLGPKHEADAFDLQKYLRGKWNDVVVINPEDGHVSFIHSSVGHYIRSLLTLQQRHLNMAFICLNYLLMDSFERPLQLSSQDPERSREQLWADYPFYHYAALRWGEHLQRSENLALEILPLLREFLDKSRPQFRTWCFWRDWQFADASGTYALEEPSIILFVQLGCVEILRFFLQPAERRAASTWTEATRSLLFGEPSDLRFFFDSLIPNDWTTMTNVEGHSVLTISISRQQAETTEFILEWDPDVNFRSPVGVTPLWAVFHPWDRTDFTVDKYILHKLLDRGADPNTCDSVEGRTPLHAASSIGDAVAVRMLLSYGAYVNVADKEGESPLQKAFYNGNPEVFGELVAAGADVDAWWSDGEVPLADCIVCDKLDLFNILLPVADVNQRNVDGLAPIHAASTRHHLRGVELNRMEYLRLLVSRPDLDLDLLEQMWQHPQESRCHNALRQAVTHLNPEMARILLEAGADPKRLPTMAESPLFYVARQGNVEFVELLLAHGSPINDLSNEQHPLTALGFAVCNDRSDVVSTLLEHGADATVDDALGKGGVLKLALDTEEPDLKIVKMLLEAKLAPDLEAPKDGEDDVNNEHPLFLAVASGNVELLRLLLDHGARLDRWLEPAPCQSPLHEAADKGSVEICDLLLQYEPRLLNAQCSEGMQNESPLHVACMGGSVEVVRFLLEKGAQADLVSFHEHATPLLNACWRASYDIVKLLLEAAPQTINVYSVDGSSPLLHVSCENDSRMLEAVLRAGADISHRNFWGRSAATLAAFDPHTTEKNVQLLLDYGMDINAVGSSIGGTPLGAAIVSKSTKHVKWLLEHGADPLRCHRLPFEPLIWRNALEVARRYPCEAILNLLLEPQWGLLEQLGKVDPLLSNTLFNEYDDRATRKAYGKIFHACEDMKLKTGEDPMAKIMHQPNFYGWSPLDLALGNVGVADHARPQCAALIIRLIRQLLSLENYVKPLHEGLVGWLSWELFPLGGYDEEAATLFTHYISVPAMRYENGIVQVVASDAHGCALCDKDIFEKSMRCRYCQEVRCSECFEVPDFTQLHEHDWLTVSLEADQDWTPNKVRDMLERVQRELTEAYPGASLPAAWDDASEDKEVTAEDAASVEATTGGETITSAEIASNEEDKTHKQTTEDERLKKETSEENKPDEAEHRANEQVEQEENVEDCTLQKSLQLATLHAFNFLAIRRPLFTPYLPLCPAVEKSIEVWMPMIKEQRRLIERQNLEMEMWPIRLWDESMYMARGLRQRYIDEEDVRRGLILQDLRFCFEMQNVGEGENNGA